MSDDDAALDRLARELVMRGFRAHLLNVPGRLAWLTVRNPDAPMLSERVTALDGSFWWPWRDEIATVDDVAAAADAVARVLAAVPAQTGS